MKVSFSRVVKEEVVFNDFNTCCSKAILCAIIKNNGSLALGQNGLGLSIRTENAKVATKVHKLLKKIYNPSISFTVSRKMKLKKNNVYIINVTRGRDILEDLGVLSGIGFEEIPPQNLIKKTCCHRAYLAGLFLACGSVNNPETSNYHLEFSVNHEEYAMFIQGLMNQYDLSAKFIVRRNKYIVYVKSSEKIGDFLRAIGASNSVMHFESTRIDRNMSNTVNRWNNCDIANEMKTISTANKQVENIETVRMFMGLDMLDEKTQHIAGLRLEFVDASLLELADLYLERYGESISKAGVHRRMKKIEEEAMRLKTMEK